MVALKKTLVSGKSYKSNCKDRAFVYMGISTAKGLKHREPKGALWCTKITRKW